MCRIAAQKIPRANLISERRFCNTMKILVTGSSGQIGSFIVEHLRDRHSVVGIDLKKCAIKDVDEITLKGDIRTAADVEKAMKDVDKVVHCAAQVSVAASMVNPLDDASHNVMGTINLLDFAAKQDVSRFVHFSSAAIYGEPVHLPITEPHPLAPLSPYGSSKLSGEIYALSYAASNRLKTTAIRPFNVYSRRQDPSNPYSGVITRFLQRIRSGEPPTIFGDGDQTRDFVHVSDVVRMVDVLLEKEQAVGKAFNCCTSVPTKISDLARTLLIITGMEKIGIKNAEPLTGEIRHSLGDNSLSKDVLGFATSVSMEDGLRMMLSGEQ